MDDIEQIRGLAQRWAAEENGDGLVLDPASDQGWSPCAFLGDSERAELFAWVRREAEREAERRAESSRCNPVMWDGIDDGDREALAAHIMRTLGWEALGSDPHGEHGRAWELCEAAGWPEVGHE